MADVSVTINDREVRKLLDELSSRVDDLRPAMNEIGSNLVSLITQSFHDGRDPWGRPWAPLSPVTIKRRRKGSSIPLRDTGRLMNSMTYHATRDSVSVGTNVSYGIMHQLGARRGQYGRDRRGLPIPWGNVPGRPFLPIRNDTVDLPAKWSETIQESLVKSITHHLSK